MGVPSNPPQKSRGWRSWLKRLLVGSGLLLVLAMVFHAPLLRWVIAVGGAKGAEMAGIKLAWQVDGSVLGDLKLSKVEARGLMIEKATIGEFTVEYDAWRAARTGEIDIIGRVALKDVDAVVDLRKMPASEAAPTPQTSATGKPPPLVWPKVIDIENVNAAITLADGKVLTIRGLTLRIGEGMPGIFECAEIKMEPGDLRLTDLKAKVAWGERELTISDSSLPYGGKLQSFRVDLRE